jgi:histone H3/H4
MAEEFTIAPIRRLLKKAGELRISDEAVNALREYVGEFGLNMAEQAVHEARQDGRKTVLESDIRKAAEKLWILESKEVE